MDRPGVRENGPGVGPAEISLVAPINLLLRRARLLLGLPLALAVLAGLYSLTRRAAVAESSFVTEGSRQRSPLIGLANQIGINLSSLGGDDVSPDFYSWLLRSRDLLTEAVRTSYTVLPGETGDSVTGTLVELYDVKAITPELKERAAVQRLRGQVSVSVDRAAGVVTLRTTARWPDLAEAINRRMFELVNEFNATRRQSGAAAQRDFAGARMAEAERDLRAAEAAFRDFLDRNRRVANAPDLMFEQARLQRDVDFRQQLYATLAQAFEQARVDAVRNTPSVTLVGQPEGSAQSSRGLFRRVVLAGGFGFILAFGIAVIGEYARRQREVWPEPYREFDQRWHRLVGRLVPSARRGRGRNAPGADEQA